MNPKKIGAFLQALRKEKGLTQTCFNHEDIFFDRTMYPDTDDEEKALIGKYQLHNPKR